MTAPCPSCRSARQQGCMRRSAPYLARSVGFEIMSPLPLATCRCWPQRRPWYYGPPLAGCTVSLLRTSSSWPPGTQRSAGPCVWLGGRARQGSGHLALRLHVRYRIAVEQFLNDIVAAPSCHKQCALRMYCSKQAVLQANNAGSVDDEASHMHMFGHPTHRWQRHMACCCLGSRATWGLGVFGFSIELWLLFGPRAWLRPSLSAAGARGGILFLPCCFVPPPPTPPLRLSSAPLVVPAFYLSGSGSV